MILRSCSSYIFDDVLHDTNIFFLTHGFKCSSLVFILCTTGFKIRKLFFSPRIAFMYFVRFSEQTEIIFLYSCKLLLTYLLSYSMEQSPSEKLTGSQIVKKFPAYYGTRRSVTAFTLARLLSLS